MGSIADRCCYYCCCYCCCSNYYLDGNPGNRQLSQDLGPVWEADPFAAASVAVGIAVGFAGAAELGLAGEMDLRIENCFEIGDGAAAAPVVGMKTIAVETVAVVAGESYSFVVVAAAAGEGLMIVVAGECYMIAVIVESEIAAAGKTALAAGFGAVADTGLDIAIELDTDLGIAIADSGVGTKFDSVFGILGVAVAAVGFVDLETTLAVERDVAVDIAGSCLDRNVRVDITTAFLGVLQR